MPINSIKSNLDILKKLYGIDYLRTTADFECKYGYEASELEIIVYGLKESKINSNLFGLALYDENPFLNRVKK